MTTRNNFILAQNSQSVWIYQNFEQYFAVRIYQFIVSFVTGVIDGLGGGDSYIWALQCQLYLLFIIFA